MELDNVQETDLTDFRRLSKSEPVVKDAIERRAWQPSMNSLQNSEYLASAFLKFFLRLNQDCKDGS